MRNRHSATIAERPVSVRLACPQGSRMDSSLFGFAPVGATSYDST